METVLIGALSRRPLLTILPEEFHRHSVVVLLVGPLVDLPHPTLPEERLVLEIIPPLPARRATSLLLALLDVLKLERWMTLGGWLRRLLLRIWLRFLLTLGTLTSFTSLGSPSLNNGVWCRRTPDLWSTVLPLTVRIPSFLLRE